MTTKPVSFRTLTVFLGDACNHSQGVGRLYLLPGWFPEQSCQCGHKLEHGWVQAVSILYHLAKVHTNKILLLTQLFSFRFHKNVLLPRPLGSTLCPRPCASKPFSVSLHRLQFLSVSTDTPLLYFFRHSRDET